MMAIIYNDSPRAWWQKVLARLGIAKYQPLVAVYKVPADIDEARRILGEKVGELNDLIGVFYDEGRGIGINLGFRGRVGMEKVDCRPYVGISVAESRRA